MSDDEMSTKRKMLRRRLLSPDIMEVSWIYYKINPTDENWWIPVNRVYRPQYILTWPAESSIYTPMITSIKIGLTEQLVSHVPVSEFATHRPIDDFPHASAEYDFHPTIGDANLQFSTAQPGYNISIRFTHSLPRQVVFLGVSPR